MVLYTNLLALLGMVDAGVSCSFCNADNRPFEDFYYKTIHGCIINEFFKGCRSFFFCFRLARHFFFFFCKLKMNPTGILNTSITKTAFPFKREISVSVFLQMSKTADIAAPLYNIPFAYPVLYLFMDLRRRHRVENGWC